MVEFRALARSSQRGAGPRGIVTLARPLPDGASSFSMAAMLLVLRRPNARPAILRVWPDSNKSSGQRRIVARLRAKMSQIGMGASLNSMAIKERSAKLRCKGDADSIAL